MNADRAFAEAVRRLRRERGISQEALAHEANITTATLARIELGKSAGQRVAEEESYVGRMVDGRAVVPGDVSNACDGGTVAEGAVGALLVVGP